MRARAWALGLTLLGMSLLPTATWAQKVRLTTSAGDIVLQLDHAKAPKTVDNFVAYVKSGHYDGTLFHRVIPTFMIQGGGVDQNGAEKKTQAPIQLESANGLRNERGTVAMARTPAPHSATAQFFINVNDNPFLDFRSETPQGWGYAVFGKVIEGMDVVDKIRTTPTDRRDAPLEPVIIKRAKLEE